MGLGMVLVVAPESAEEVLGRNADGAFAIGDVRPGAGVELV